MTTLIEAPSVQHFTEDPEVKKQNAHLAVDNRTAFWNMLASVGISFMVSMILALIISCFISASAYVGHQSNEPWLAITNILIFLLVVPSALYGTRDEIRWLFTDKGSPLATYKLRRKSIKAARLAAKRLGSTVIPVLTAEHVSSAERIYKAMTTTAEASQGFSKTDSREYDRIAFLLFENINREQTMLSIINDRGLFSVNEIEAALQDMESHTSGPVQSGWL